MSEACDGDNVLGTAVLTIELLRRSLFESVDKEGGGAVPFSALHRLYNPSEHPGCIVGALTVAESEEDFKTWMCMGGDRVDLDKFQRCETA